VAAFTGASITLIGAKTTVHHNCTKGNSDEYGLTVFGSSSSTIQLVAPLTKEQVALDNGGGGNWGANAKYGGDIHQIKTIVSVVAAKTSHPSTAHRLLLLLLLLGMFASYGCTQYLHHRPLFATNLIGILLPLLSPLLHLKHVLSVPAFEVETALPFVAKYVTPNQPFDRSTVPPAPNYDNDDAWAALWPRIDTADLISQGWYQEHDDDQDDQDDQDDPVQTQDHARCDLFYLHPTTYLNGQGWNGPYNDSGAGLMVDEGIVFQQASAFHLGCRVYAPRFRQMTAAGYLNRTQGRPALDLAYKDVKAAFDSFLFRRNTECSRSIVLASHSQGNCLKQRVFLKQ
jgi:hypothetical protein